MHVALPECCYELLIVCLCTHQMHVTLQQQALACSVKHVFSDIYSLLHADQVMLNMPESIVCCTASTLPCPCPFCTDGLRIDGKKWKVDYAIRDDFKYFGWKWTEGGDSPTPSPPMFIKLCHSLSSYLSACLALSCTGISLLTYALINCHRSPARSDRSD